MYVLSLLNANWICSYRNKMEKISNQASTKKCKKCLPCKINYKENPKRGFVSLQIFDIRVEKSFLGRPHWKWGTFYPRYYLVPTFIVGITVCSIWHSIRLSFIWFSFSEIGDWPLFCYMFSFLYIWKPDTKLIHTILTLI